MTNIRITDLLKNNSEEVTKVIQSSTSITVAAKRLGVSANNTLARKHIKAFADAHNIAFSVKEKSPANTPMVSPKVTAEQHKKLIVEKYFIVHQSATSGNAAIKSYILRYDLIPYICSAKDCGLPGEWKGKMLSLHLDHKDGNKQNCTLENLRFLCPNCHSQTDTYTARNSNAYKDMPTSDCLRCGEISKSGDYCRACKPYVSASSEKPELPSISQLIREAATYNPSYVSKKYGLDIATLKKVIAAPENYSTYPSRSRIVFPETKEVEAYILSNPSLSLAEVARHYDVPTNPFYTYIRNNNISGVEPYTPAIQDECACGKQKSSQTKYCSTCRPSQLNAKYPPVEELLSRVELEGYEVLSRELGVSGNAIRKHLKVRTGSYPKTRSRLTKP